MEAAEQEEGDENARGANKKPAPKPAPKHDIPENLTNAGELDRSDSKESDDSVRPNEYLYHNDEMKICIVYILQLNLNSIHS